MWTETEWRGCYRDGWKGILTDESFQHPAKFSRGLIRRIYGHMMERGWLSVGTGSTVVDPFGGVACGARDALELGLHWRGCELEPKFVELAQANIALWNSERGWRQTWGTAEIIQGDSRRLSEILGQAQGAVSSPPYSETEVAHIKSSKGEAHKLLGTVGHRNQTDGYGQSPGQLGSMPAGDVDAILTSPPYASARIDGNGDEGASGLRMADGSYPRGKAGWEARKAAGGRYGDSGSQLANMPEGDAAAAITSPPFGQALSGGGISKAMRGEGDYKITTTKPGTVYGDGHEGQTPGNLDALPTTGFDAFDAVVRQNIENSRRVYQRMKEKNDVSPETFWDASREILLQLAIVLKPGAMACFVLKDFVRAGKRVPFSDNWRRLAESCGFETVEWVRALLVEDFGTQHALLGEDVRLRKKKCSFFRRLAEARGAPPIDHEDVLFMRRKGD